MRHYTRLDPKQFARALSERGDGLYVIGLNCHVGFIWIEKGRACFVHSNYVNPEEGVTSEPVELSRAIENSQEVGYWVTPLLQDERLIEFWLTDQVVPLQKLGQLKRR